MFANAPGSPIPFDGGPGNVLVGDMNNDGKLDLVISSSSARTITVLEGKGDGQFGDALSSLNLAEAPGEMALGDLNRDGKLDVAVSSHDSYGVVVLIGDGKGALAIAPTSPIVMKLGQHPHTHGLALSDLNRDGSLDLITCNNADNDISIAFGDGRNNFARAPKSFPVGPSPYPFAIGDVNKDGWPDIVVTASATGPSRQEQLPLSRALTLLLSDKKGRFEPRQLSIRTGEPWFAAISDLNSDGNPDIVATHHELNALTVMMGDGRGGFAEVKESPFDFGVSLFQIVIADINLDGRMDIVGASGDRVRVLPGNGRGSFSSAASLPAGPGAWRLVAVDLNGDGAVDLVTTNSESKSLSVFLNRLRSQRRDANGP